MCVLALSAAVVAAQVVHADSNEAVAAKKCKKKKGKRKRCRKAAPVTTAPSTTTPPTTTTALPGQSLTVAVTPAQATSTITSSPAGIDCHSTSGTCNHVFDYGTVVTLTANPNTGAGESFAGWSGDCSGLTPTCQLTMDSAHVASAAFVAN